MSAVRTFENEFFEELDRGITKIIWKLIREAISFRSRQNLSVVKRTVW
jgi:hypothetical protein